MVSAFALLPRVLMVLGVMTLLPSSAPGRSYPPPPKPEPVILGGPKAWALATTAHLTYRNGWYIDRLTPKDRVDSCVAETRQILRDWWRIENRRDLLQALDWLTLEGHRVDFMKRTRPLVAMTDAEFLAASSRQPSETTWLMRLCREHYRKRGRNSLVAWDYCRYIMLCRCGYQLGFLSEDEAWGRIMPKARALQAAFPSWSELGEDYLVGRQFWSSAETRKTGQYYRELEAWLVREPRSPWNRLAWNMDLGAGQVSTAR